MVHMQRLLRRAAVFMLVGVFLNLAVATVVAIEVPKTHSLTSVLAADLIAGPTQWRREVRVVHSISAACTGLVRNSLAVALTLLVLSGVPSAARYHFRLGATRCVACGYRSGNRERCSECGADMCEAGHVWSDRAVGDRPAAMTQSSDALIAGAERSAPAISVG